MATFRRDLTQGGTYFFTLASAGRRQVFSRPEVIEALRQAIRQVGAQLPLTIIAWVILPDHMHAIWTLPDGDADYARRWGLIKRAVSRDVRGAHATGDVGNDVRGAHATDPGSVRTAHVLGIANLPLSTSQKKRHESGLWQRRFWEHRIRDEDDLQRHIDYIHYNPVKHGWVDRAEDWPYSTFHRFVRLGLLNRDWASGPVEAREYGE